MVSEWKGTNKDLFSAGRSQDLRALFCMYLVTFEAAIEKSVDSLELTNTPERLL